MMQAAPTDAEEPLARPTRGRHTTCPSCGPSHPRTPHAHHALDRLAADVAAALAAVEVALDAEEDEMSRREISLSEAGPREGAHPPVLALRIVWRRRAAQCEPSLIVIACSTFTDMDSMMIPYCPLHFAAIESVEMLLRVDGRRRRETSAAAAAMLLSFVGRLQPSTFCGGICMEPT